MASDEQSKSSYSIINVLVHLFIDYSFFCENEIIIVSFYSVFNVHIIYQLSDIYKSDKKKIESKLNFYINT